MSSWKRPYRESESDRYFWDGCLRVEEQASEVRPLPEEDEHRIAANHDRDEAKQ